MYVDICDCAGAGICDGMPSTCSSLQSINTCTFCTDSDNLIILQK